MNKKRVPFSIFFLLLIYTLYLHSNYSKLLNKQEKDKTKVIEHDFQKDTNSKNFLTIGTGGIGGVYFPAGGVIAENINRKKNDLKLKVVSTAGSIYNIKAVAAGEFDIALTQASTLYSAVNGIGEWKNLKPQHNIRMICNLYAESLMLVVAEDSGIKNLEDLKGKSISIGPEGSGTTKNVSDLFNAPRMKDIYGSVKKYSLPTNIAVSKLQLGQIDGFFFSSGHPARIISMATMGKRKVRFVPITEMESLLGSKPYYAETLIPKNVYPYATNEEDIPSIGDPVVIITSSGVDKNLIRKFTRSIFTNINELRNSHPALKNLNTDNMLDTTIAPFHSGASEYLINAALIPENIEEEEIRIFVLGTGNVDSLSHIMGGAIVKMINEKKEKYNVRMVVETSAGGLENIEGVISGRYNLGIASCFDLVNAYSAKENWQGKTGKKTLRAMADLFKELVVLYARDSQTTSTFDELIGKKVCIGPKGSSLSRVALYILEEHFGRDLKKIELCYQQAESLPEVFSDKSLDCAFFSIPHLKDKIPQNRFNEAVSTIAENMPEGAVQVSLPANGHPSYNFIPQKINLNNKTVSSFSYPTILFSSKNMPCPTTGKIIKILQNSADIINKTYPRLVGYKFNNAISSKTIPLHKGILSCSKQEKIDTFKYPSEPTRISIGVTRTFHASYPVGGALCRLLDDYLDAENKEIAAVPEYDSKVNIKKVLDGEIDFAIVPSTDCHKAFNGLSRWNNTAEQDLRAICSLYNVPLTIIAAGDVEENEEMPEFLSDIKGKRVSESISPIYGHRGNSISIFNLNKFKATLNDLYAVNPEEGNIEEALHMFQNSKIEAIFCSVPHPSDIVTSAISGPRKGVFIPITGWHNYISEKPYYCTTNIPIEFYRLNQTKNNLGTIAVPLLLVTSKNQSSQKVDQVIRCIYKNFGEFKRYYSTMKGMTDKNLSQGLTIPLHPGAEKYIELIGSDRLEASLGKFTRLTLGTGTINGVFYPVGSSIEKVFNQEMVDKGMRLSVESTEGSISNIQAVSSKALELGLVETTTLYSAIKGEDKWENNQQKNVKAICRLHMGYLMLIASEKSGIKTLRDIAGKRVNIGNIGSGTRGNIEDFLRLEDMEWLNEIKPLELKINPAVEAFVKGEIDAFFFNVGLESKVIYRAIGGKTKARFIPITNVESLLNNNKGYVKTYIPHKLFPKILNTEDIETVGTPTILVTSLGVAAEGKNDPVYYLTKAIFENFNELKQSQDALKNLSKEYMSRNLVAPIHPSALKYYKEIKLRK